MMISGRQAHAPIGSPSSVSIVSDLNRHEGAEQIASRIAQAEAGSSPARARAD